MVEANGIKLRKPSEFGIEAWPSFKRRIIAAVPQTINDEVFDKIQGNLPDEEPEFMAEPYRGILYHRLERDRNGKPVKGSGLPHSMPVRLDPDAIQRLLGKGFTFSPPLGAIFEDTPAAHKEK